MKIDTIFDNWKVDAEIDKTEIADEIQKISKLHHKYYMILSGERLTLRKYKEDMKKLRLDKFEFFNNGPNEDTELKGWVFPQNKILKGDQPAYVDADNDITSLSLKIGIQEEKVELLMSIINSINNRGYHLNTALQWHKFTNGIN